MAKPIDWQLSTPQESKDHIPSNEQYEPTFGKYRHAIGPSRHFPRVMDCAALHRRTTTPTHNNKIKQRTTMKTMTIPTRDQVSPDNQGIFDNWTKNLGMTPNLYAAYANSKTALGTYLAFQNSSKGALNNKEREAINLVVSRSNGCRYCQSAHTVPGGMNGFSPEQILDLRAGHSEDAKLNALVAFAKEVMETKGRVSERTRDAFFAAGDDQGHVADTLMAIGDKIISNYLHNFGQFAIDFPVAVELEEATA